MHFRNILISSKPTILYTFILFLFKKITLWVDLPQQPAEMTRRHLHRNHTGDVDIKVVTAHTHTQDTQVCHSPQRALQMC